MEIYLVVITTALVLTQIIRLMQNNAQLKHIKRKKAEEKEVVEKWKRMADAIDRLIERVG